MTEPPIDALRDGLARGLARFLAPARLPPDGFAAAFAEAPRGTVFDLGANAAAAEALAHARPGGAQGAIELLLAYTAAGPAPRAVGPARLRVDSDSPRDLLIETPHHRFTGDLHRGEIRQHLHGQDGPPAAIHGGNLVEFAYRGRRQVLDVEDAIVEAGLERFDGGARLFHESLLRGRGGFARGAERDLATLRYTYEIRTASPAITLAVALTPLPGIVLERVRITTACDAMSPGGDVGYDTILADDRRIPSPEGGNVTVHEGPAAVFGAAQTRGAERALTLLIRPRDPALLLNIKAVGPAPGRLHWLLARYATERLAYGESFVVEEERLLLRGGAVPLAVPRGADAAAAAPAMALALALAAEAGRGTPAAAALRGAAARLLAGFAPEVAGPAEIAQALMAAQALRRAGAAPAIDTADLLAELRIRQDGRGVFREAGEAPTSVGDHAAAVLALARECVLAEGAPFTTAIRRALAAVVLTTLDGPLDTLGLCDGAAAASTEDLAGLLRALRAVQAARASGALSLPDGEAWRVAFLAGIATTLLQARIRPEGDALVVAAGAPGSAPSVRAQAATLAALLPPEGALLRAAA